MRAFFVFIVIPMTFVLFFVAIFSTPIEKAMEYAIEYAENKFPYDIGVDDNWNEKHALVEEVAETACLFMHEWTKE